MTLEQYIENIRKLKEIYRKEMELWLEFKVPQNAARYDQKWTDLLELPMFELEKEWQRLLTNAENSLKKLMESLPRNED